MKNPLQGLSYLYYKATVTCLCFIFTCCKANAQCGMTINTNISNVTCYNGTNGAITVSVTGGTAPYLYQMAEAGAGAWSSTSQFNGLAANIYPVSVKDNTGCIKTIYATVTQPANYNISFTAGNVTCLGGNNGSISVAVSGGTAPYTYSWKKDNVTFSTTANISSLWPGGYQLTVTDAAGCATAPAVAQLIRAVGLTGFNEDVVANGTNTSPGSVTTQAFDDGNGAVLYEHGYTNANNVTEAPGGLPVGGAFNSTQNAARPYQLATYASNNSLVLRSSTANSNGGAVSGTLSFQSQFRTSYSTLYVLAATGSGTGTVNYTVNFADGSTATGQLLFADWYLASSTQSAIKLKRVNRTSGVFDTRYDFNLFELPISIPVPQQSKNINSVGFTWVDAGSARVNIMGITGYTSTATGISILDGSTANVTPSVSISSNANNNTFCSGQSVTFTALPVNGGNAPAYQWKKNNIDIAGATNATYTTTGLVNNDIIQVQLTSSLTCVSSSNAGSNSLTMQNGTQVPAVTLISNATNICSGVPVLFTALPVNGGLLPVYQWKLNNNNIGGNSPSYLSSSLNNGDQVKVQMTSSIACAASSPVTSTPLSMNVSLNVAPAISLMSSPALPGQGYPVTFNALISNGGLLPTYQWYKNGNIIAGANAATLTVAAPMYNEVFSVRLTSNHPCASTPYAMSNYITVGPGVLPVNLLWYHAKAQNGTALLEWKTSQEVNSRRFILERAAVTNPNAYTTIGYIPSSNNTNGAVYNYTDVPLPGIYLYQLKQEDIDGRIKSLGIRRVDLSGKTSWQLQDNGTQWILAANGNFNARLLDMQGRLLQLYKATGSQVIAKPVMTGIYVLQVETGGTFSTQRLLVQ